MKQAIETIEPLDEKTEIKAGLLKLANDVRKIFLDSQISEGRNILRRENGGDPHFKLDECAEQAVEDFLKGWSLPIAAFSEDRGLISYNDHPEWIFIIDPIDGTRPALANFESCCFSAAVTPYSDNPKFGDIKFAMVMELKSGDYFYAGPDGMFSTKKGTPTKNTDTDRMFWSTELTAHPIMQLARVYEDLIDNSVTLGAVFVFTSSSYSLTRIVSGQLDAHVDVGHRLVQDDASLMKDFLRVGRGKLVTLFSYDIAAAAYILIKAGGAVTDAYGKSLENLALLTDKSLQGQCSIIAASNKTLHKCILDKLRFGA
jgi:myo-inositol-1(or 4)-monophosphatase